jgi:asparagine synthase (glutamine-hydrolysing)
MCAISGCWNFNGLELLSDFVQILNDRQRHRGPDGAGCKSFLNGQVILGHCRLSILDVSIGASQPMISECGRFSLTFNGEIFNFLEIRSELKNKGYHFKTNSDSEVLLAAFVEWGEACQTHFNGMWAFAIWDDLEKRLFLSRDRFGVKPLHYIYSPGRYFAFASQANVFSGIDDKIGFVDEGFLAKCLESPFSLEGSGFTIYHGIRQIPAGCQAWVNQEQIRIERWWDTEEYIENSPAILSYDAAVERLRELLSDACRLRLRSDVPMATALSGGMDSSSVYATVIGLAQSHEPLQRLPSNWRRAFCGSLPGTDLDETASARAVAKFVGGTVESVQYGAINPLEWIEDITRKLDFVIGTPGIMTQTYRAMRENNFLVSLDGHGVDEMCYGYSHNVQAALDDANAAGDLERSAELRGILERMNPAWLRKQAVRSEHQAGQNGIHRFWNYFKSGIDFRCRRLLGRPPAVRSAHPWLKIRGAALEGHADHVMPRIPEHFSPADKKLFEEFHVKTLPSLLRNYDRFAMLHGVEIRMPFMDWRIVCHMFSIPQHFKLGEGFTKRILRDAMKDGLPDSVRLDPVKKGWNAPLVEWFSHPLKDFVMDHLGSRDFLISPVWKGREIRRFAENRYKHKDWTWLDCSNVWLFLNAHLVQKTST